MSKAKYLLYILFLYAFLFTPQLKAIGANIPSTWLFYPIALYTIANYSKDLYKFCGKFKVEISLIVFIFLFTLLRVLMGGDVEFLKKNFLCLFDLIIVPFALIKLGQKMKANSQRELFNFLYITGTIAITITTLCLIFPDIHQYVRDNIMIFSEDDYLYKASFRGFGIGGQLTSHYAFVLGILISISLFYINSGKWFLFMIPFAFLAAMVNARTGVLVGVTGVFLFLFYSGRIVVSFIAMVLGILFYNYFFDILSIFGVEEYTSLWIGEFFDQLEMMSSGNANQSILSTYSKMVFFPDSISGWIVGLGLDTFSGGQVGSARVRSDIGFVNQLIFGGLIYISLLYILLFYLVKRLHRNGHKALSVYIVIIFLIINFKGDFLPYTPSFKLIMLVYYILIMSSAKHTMSDNNHYMIYGRDSKLSNIYRF